MSFFDTKLMGDLMQRMNDHSRVNNFLTNQALSVTFAMLTFVVFTVVLLFYNKLIFAIFLAGSLLYGLWMTLFLRRRKVLDYELFEQQAINNNKTYEFITSMQEIKLQDCEQRRRWEWEDTQVDLFNVQMKSLKLQQTQEISLERINEIHRAEDENGKDGLRTSLADNSKGIDIEGIIFKYDPHALRKTLDDATIHIPRER